MAEFEILDLLQDESDERIRRYMEINPGTYVASKIFECEEPFPGSAENTRLFIFSNYMSKTGLVNLAIVIRETPTGKEEKGDVLSVRSNVETTIFPLYFTPTPVYEMPEKVEAPDITPQRAKFILEKRNLPKKKPLEEFNPLMHKWTVNQLASELNMSNRLVAQYCKSMGI